MKLAALFSLLAVCAVPLVAQDQGPQRQQGQQARPNRPAIQGRAQALDEAGVTPAEIQRMFDAYALVQAQEQLQLGDEQYSRFLIRFKALQDRRRQALQEHTRIVGELRRLLMQRQPDEGQLKDRIQALEDADSRAIADIKKAHEGIDQVLDVRQRASFRVFEEQMERRKLELVTRARQGNRQNQPQ